jgi:hypothetical protein
MAVLPIDPHCMRLARRIDAWPVERRVGRG